MKIFNFNCIFLSSFSLFAEVQAIMRTIIYIIIVLLAVQSVIRAESTTDVQFTTTQEMTHNDDHDEQIKTSNSWKNNENEELDKSEATTEKLPITDKETQIKVEKNLLTLFGMAKRPKPIDRSKIVIPQAMKALYAEIMGEELRETVNFPKPGLHTKSANTVRSFTHEGMYIFYSILFKLKFRSN